jgi:hypothetical protein
VVIKDMLGSTFSGIRALYKLGSKLARIDAVKGFFLKNVVTDILSIKESATPACCNPALLFIMV